MEGGRRDAQGVTPSDPNNLNLNNLKGDGSKEPSPFDDLTFVIDDPEFDVSPQDSIRYRPVYWQKYVDEYEIEFLDRCIRSFIEYWQGPQGKDKPRAKDFDARWHKHVHKNYEFWVKTFKNLSEDDVNIDRYFEDLKSMTEREVVGEAAKYGVTTAGIKTKKEIIERIMRAKLRKETAQIEGRDAHANHA
jgi:hypothetical protein